MSDLNFIEVTPTTNRGNAEPKKLINLRYIVAIDKNTDGPVRGNTVIGYFDGTTISKLEVHEPYSYFVAQILIPMPDRAFAMYDLRES